jgi:hypothetical protein
MAEARVKAPWEVLQAPFDAESISLLPRATGDKDKRHKEKCSECGGYHEFPCIHLSYVGHADITMRLNEADPTWTWEPFACDENGLPALDENGCLWAHLTILGVTKPAFGDPGTDWQGKSKAHTPDGMKEAIGDMLRNGAMRFGVGTALWSKSDKAKATLADDTPTPSPAPYVEDAKRQRGEIITKADKLGWDDDALSAWISEKSGGKFDAVADLPMKSLQPMIDVLDKLLAEQAKKS